MILLDNSLTNTILLFIVVGANCFLVGLTIGHVLRRADNVRREADNKLAAVHKALQDINRS